MAKTDKTVPKWADLDHELRELLEPTDEERSVLNEGQLRARLYVAFGRSLRDAAKNLEGTDHVGCTYGTLKKRSARFGWYGLRKRIKAHIGKTEAEIVAGRAAEEAVRKAGEIPVIIETPEQIHARHFKVSTDLLHAVERSIRKYHDGLPEYKEVSRKKVGGSVTTKKRERKSGVVEETTKTKGTDGHTVSSLKLLADIARIAMAERRKAAGIDDDDIQPPNPMDDATALIVGEMMQMDESSLQALIDRELDKRDTPEASDGDA